MRAVPTATAVINVLTSRSLTRPATAATAAVPNAGDVSAVPVGGATDFLPAAADRHRGRAPSPYVLYAGLPQGRTESRAPPG
ncbi:hypothetical protein BKA18_005980 [Streptomyces auratus]